MAVGKTGAIVVTGTSRRDLIIRTGALVCLAKILRPTVPANAAEREGSADFRIISGSESVVWERWYAWVPCAMARRGRSRSH
jgi:hypothetical protein